MSFECEKIVSSDDLKSGAIVHLFTNISKDFERISLDLSTSSITPTVDNWPSTFLSLEELPRPLSKKPSHCKYKDHVSEFALVFRALSGEGPLNSLIAFSKLAGICDPIFHSWKVNLNTDAEWRLSHDADAPHKEA
jgi:hypothetical protein